MRSLVALCLAFFSVTSAIAHEQDQTVSVGPWTIGTSFKAERFDSCAMSRSADNLNITFVRSHEGLLLLLDLVEWKLDRGKATTLCGWKFAISPGKSARRNPKRNDRSATPPSW